VSARTRRRRAEARYGPETGTTYLLHFTDAGGNTATYRHAGHYIGWTQDLAARLEAHAAGGGARLTEVVRAAGLRFTLARTWPGTTRDTEDSLKHQGGGRRFCPECGVTPRTGQRIAASPEPRPAQEPVARVEPARDSLISQLTGREATALLGALGAGAQAAWRIARPGLDYGPRLGVATELTKLHRAEAAAAEAPRQEKEAADAMNDRQRAARTAGAQAAEKVIQAQASAGASTDRMDAHAQDTAAWLFTDGRGPEGEAFARGYDETAQAMVTEFREDGQRAPDHSPGAPHPDPFLAHRGWQACEHGDGVYVRRQAAAEADIEREAG
jgi:hypothetical protein